MMMKTKQIYIRLKKFLKSENNIKFSSVKINDNKKFRSWEPLEILVLKNVIQNTLHFS